MADFRLNKKIEKTNNPKIYFYDKNNKRIGATINPTVMLDLLLQIAEKKYSGAYLKYRNKDGKTIKSSITSNGRIEKDIEFVDDVILDKLLEY